MRPGSLQHAADAYVREFHAVTRRSCWSQAKVRERPKRLEALCT